MSSAPKTHDNRTVLVFLDGYYCAAELCEEHPCIDDILSGALSLQTAGDTSTRSLSRQVLFHILQRCPTIDVDAINEATSGHYAYRSLAGYAAVARVSSKAIEGYIRGRKFGPSVVSLRQAIDAPYADELAIAVAQCKPWTPCSRLAPQAPTEGGLSMLRRFALGRLVEA